MSLRNYLKKYGKRKAGTWGRINHWRDMRAESKALRKHVTTLIKEAADAALYEKEMKIVNSIKVIYPGDKNEDRNP